MKPEFQSSLRCPACLAPLRHEAAQIHCESPPCARTYPIINGIPILLYEENSVFRIQDYTAGEDTFYQEPKRGGAKQALLKLLPDWGRNIKAADNFKKLAALLKQRPGRPKILVLGGSVFNRGMDPLLDPAFDILETDVAFGERTQLIVDGHNMPLATGTFDAVVAQAVLEHVAAPWIVAEEIHRVLKDDGIAYIETPFLQAVHAGPYDFTRFTHLGHRRLFRRFQEIESGAVCGPGVMFASSYFNFLTALPAGPRLRKLAALIAHLTIFWPKWLDGWLIDRPATLDCAFGYYFLGQRSENTLSDRELIACYRGGQTRMKRRTG